MSTQDSNIKPLPPDVVGKIKSSTSITHLNDVIVELVKNALDANAHSIIVTVDFQRGGCVVEDDGEGIPPAEFELGGGLGRAHRTCFLPEVSAHLGRSANTLNRHFQVSVGKRGPRSERVVSSVAGLSVFTHCYIPSPAPSRHKYGDISPLNANRALGSSSGTAAPKIQ